MNKVNRQLTIGQKLVLSFLLLSMILVLSLFTEKVTIIRPKEIEQEQVIPNNEPPKDIRNN